MKITRCINSHFFDGDKYTVCPVCGGAIADGSATASGAAATPVAPPPSSTVPSPVEANAADDSANKKEAHKGGIFGLFSKKDKEKTNDDHTVAMDMSNLNYSETSQAPAMTSQVTEYISSESQQVQPQQQYNQPSAYEQSPVQQYPPVQEQNAYTNGQISVDLSQHAGASTTISGVVPEQPAGPTELERKKVIDTGKTQAIYSSVEEEPVVGWLVCIKGEDIGLSYTLKAGKNTIGRGANMDVALVGERSVSRERHAIIIYEPKKRQFLVQPGDGNGLAYLNDELLMSFQTLKDGDSLQLGEAVFRFVPLCGENFTWDDYIG